MNEPQLQPYLAFKGNCKEAMEFYQSVLGGKLELSTFADYASKEMPVSDEQKDKIMHATLQNGSLSFMASDAMNQKVGDNISLSIAGTDDTKLTGFFEGLSTGGKITQPLKSQVWGDKFGMLIDKYGINWMINISAGDKK